ncbi:MAG TPA: hypothetical protein VG890_13405, partial [Puia sp.]|nr:hypothetical protein [Puia sp.]
MKYSGLYKKRKWHRHSRIPLILLLISSIILATIFYTIRYRFSTVLEYIVEKETGGRYAFYAKSMNISLLKKRIIMDEGEVVCQDSSDENAHYNLAIPRIYFSIASWKELLFRKKIVIDSFSIINPQFSVYTVKADTVRRSRPFHPGDILTYLEETLEHLNARSLSIRN